VSDRTLLGLLPFVKNADEELEAVKTQKEESMELFRMEGGMNANEDEEEEQ